MRIEICVPREVPEECFSKAVLNVHAALEAKFGKPAVSSAEIGIRRTDTHIIEIMGRNILSGGLSLDCILRFVVTTFGNEYGGKATDLDTKATIVQRVFVGG